jgi:transposase IS204/IS1001/IS1096/IS1165 family protein
LRLSKAATTRRLLTCPTLPGAAEALLGLPGFRAIEVDETPRELVVVIELIAEIVGCPGCGVVARAHGRSAVGYRDLAAFGRPARLRSRKRRFRCEEPRCRLATRSADSPEFSSRCLLTNRAGLECCLQVGLNARRSRRSPESSASAGTR